MFPKCQSRYTRVAIASVSMTISMVFIVFVEGLPRHRKEGDEQIMNHICLLQIFGSVLLIVGSIKYIRWLLLPWLLIAVVFVYGLVYISLSYWFQILSNTRHSLLTISLLYLISGSWCYFIYAVYLDFQEMTSTRGTQQIYKYVYEYVHKQEVDSEHC